MKEIILPSGHKAIVDDIDYPRVCEMRWCLLRRKYKSREWVYAISTYPKPGVCMHRLLVGAKKGDYVDHINGNGLDNTRKNLRLCTQYQNLASQRMPVNNKSGYKGVYYSRGKKDGRARPWRARIRHQKQEYNLGQYATAVEAALAYDAKSVELNGEFALTNKGLGLL